MFIRVDMRTKSQCLAVQEAQKLTKAQKPGFFARPSSDLGVSVLRPILGLSARIENKQFQSVILYVSAPRRYVYLVVSNLMIGWLVLLTLFMTMER